MKKTFFYVMSAVLGICIAITLHLSFMVVEARGTKMLPTIEPEQTVLVCLMDKSVKSGDVIAYKKPFYDLDGEGYIAFRRVKEVQEEGLLLTCDMQLAVEQEDYVSKEDILGKVVLINID